MTPRGRLLLALCFIVGIPLSVSAQLSKSVGLLKGEVVSPSGTPIPNVTIAIFKGTDKVTTTKSNSEGKVTSVLQPNATYRIVSASSEYFYHEDTVTVPALSSYQEFPVHIVLTPLTNGQPFDLTQPVFLPHERDIDRAALAELDRIAEEMKHNPKLSVSITVYPDAPVRTKKDAAQKALASSRETAIRSYFMGKGIPSSRFDVTSVTTSIPPGRFPNPAAAAAPKKKGKKSKTPPEPALFPQYVEIVAHVAP